MMVVGHIQIVVVPDTLHSHLEYNPVPVDYSLKVVVDHNNNQSYLSELQDHQGFAIAVKVVVDCNNHYHLPEKSVEMVGQLTGPNWRHIHQMQVEEDSLNKEAETCYTREMGLDIPAHSHNLVVERGEPQVCPNL